MQVKAGPSAVQNGSSSGCIVRMEPLTFWQLNVHRAAWEVAQEVQAVRVLLGSWRKRIFAGGEYFLADW